jgi:hypothetical protein
MRRTTIVAAGIISAVIGHRAAHACSCEDYTNDPVEAMGKASIVIAAKVVSINRVEGMAAFDGHAMPLVRFEVLREWKGTGLREYSVFAWYVWPIDGKGNLTPMFDCVHQVTVGESYVFFARPLSDGKGHMIDFCLPGALYREAAEIAATLDKATHRKKSAAPPNKGMKLTSVEHIGRSQLIPGVRPTLELRRGLRLGDDLVQSFDDLRQFSGVCASETAADALCGERPNLADLDP